jgi:pimeloyl-ACP methyl ester carboxylesterase
MSHVLQGPAGEGAAGGSAKASASAGAGAKPTFVFVHGAWHGAWCWAHVVRLLGAQGYAAIALDLPGHGLTARLPNAYGSQDLAALATEVSPLAALTTLDYRDLVLSVVRGLCKGGSGPVVLVGHSLGGATLTAVAEAEPTLIRRLVYLTAFAPVLRPTPLEYIQLPSMATAEVPPLFAGDPNVIACARINFNAADPAKAAANKSAFYGDVSDAVYAPVVRLLTPDEPIGALVTPVIPTVGQWGSVPRTYIRCTQDRAIPIAGQDQMIAEADQFTPHNRFVQETLATSHSPFLSAPDDVVSLLVKATA